jgi:lipopolysaccharide/colanic/teichoic acid biosynthesis glycosyltransferase
MSSYPGKRALDVLAAGTACAVFAPVVVGVTLAVWLEDGGPPLFSQSRVGQRRNPFTLLKFRSMRNAQVTRVGQWLRRTGIDELPQFVNVVRGEMSVVGPRPLTSQDVERLGWAGTDHDWRFAAKPGITGLSQLLAGRGARASERLDRLYLRRQSLLLDLQLVALSFAVNIAGKRKIRRFLRRGAY